MMSSLPPECAAAEPRAGISPEWYEAAFGAEYLRIYRRRTRADAVAEAELAATELGLERGSRVLDLGCGAGRHLEPLLASGFPAVGLDRSSELLTEARRGLARQGIEPEGRLVLGDMRQLPFGSRFSAVLSFFSSFGYFFDDAENDRVVGEIARVLEPRGSFFLDLMNRAFVLSNLVPLSERREKEFTIRERRWISPDGKRVEKEILVDGGSERSKPRCYHESVRLYSLPEVESTLSSHGLELEKILGDFRGARYSTADSPRMLLIGRKENA